MADRPSFKVRFRLARRASGLGQFLPLVAGSVLARGEGIKLFYFSSFDEPWKLAQEGEVGTRWGLWDKDERAKYQG